MTATAWVLWVLNVVLDTAGQMAFKAAASASHVGSGKPAWHWLARHPLLWAGVACYAIEFVTWLAFLALVPLSTAVLLAATNIITVMLGGRLVFDEPGGVLRTTGIVLIAIGVAVVGLNGT